MIIDQSSYQNEYPKSVGGTKFSLMVLAKTHLKKLRIEPVLSFVLDGLAPPKGC
jgi:hypothetical protein